MSLLIDLEDYNALEKLGLALCKIPSVLTELSKNVMVMPESRAVIIEHVKDSVNNPEFRTALKGFVIDLVKEDIDFKESLKEAFDYSIAISDHKILKRLFEHDILLGLEEPFDSEEERAPNLPEQIKELSDRIEQPLNNSPNELKEVTPVIETTKDLKACAIVEYLKTEAAPNDFGEFVIGKKELTVFMKNVVDEGLRVKSVSRQLKADLFERAVKLFPGIVYIKKSPSGNKTQMLALKESSKRTITHGLTRKAPLGILI